MTLMIPVTPYLYLPAPPNATKFQVDNGRGVFAHEADNFPINGLTGSLQFGQIATIMGTGIAQGLSGIVSAGIGRKNALYIYTFGGAAAFVVAGLSMDWNMYAYWAMRLVTGLFAGSAPIVKTYIVDLWADATPQVKMKKMMAPMGSMIVASLVGPIIGMAVVATNVLSLPLYIAGALEFFAGIMVFMYIPNIKSSAVQSDGNANAVVPAKDESSTPADDSKKGEDTVYLKWVALFWGARLFDRIGGGQFQWFQTQGVREFGQVALTMLPPVIVCMSFVAVLAVSGSMSLNKKLGLAGVGIVGQTIAAIMFVVLSYMTSVWAYSAVMLILQCFSFLASMLIDPSIIALVPPSKKALWIGYQGAFAQITQAFGPLILQKFLNMELDCSRGTKTNCAGVDGLYLKVNAIACAISAVCYMALLFRFPVPKKQADPPTEEEVAAMLKFEATGDVADLSMPQLLGIQKKRLDEGNPMLKVRFGTFSDDLEKLPQIMSVAERDFKFFMDLTPQRIKMFQEGCKEDFRKRCEILKMNSPDGKWSKESREEWSAWMMDWLEYAGYLDGSYAPNLHKAIFMTAYPPIVAGGLSNELAWEKYISNPVPTWLKIDRWMGMYLTMNKMNQQEAQALCLFRANQCQVAGTS
mmetsp:Transcript_42092/g.61885  ORF Transcript_42092/g.61885 Transcript_42092/m.61885 type:complete len:638 (-) Transcript_42092:103-2016(-)